MRRRRRLLLIGLLLIFAAAAAFALRSTRPGMIAWSLVANSRYWRAWFRHSGEMMADNGPVQFHARALDQDGKPVADVSMYVEVDRYDLWRMLPFGGHSSTSREERIILTSDADGWFHLRGKRGHVLRIESVEKPGYLWSSDLFIHYDYTPRYMPTNAAYADAKQGVVFHLWRKGPTEPVIPVGYRISLPAEHPKALINLTRGVVFDDIQADLEFTKTMLAVGDPNRPYDRRYEIKGLHGTQLQMSDAPYGYLAPESGYESKFAEDRILSSPSFASPPEWTRIMFVKARGGAIYASLKVRFTSDNSRFEISGYVNPSGSRVLEPDQAKLITDPDQIRRLDEATRRK